MNSQFLMQLHGFRIRYCRIGIAMDGQYRRQARTHIGKWRDAFGDLHFVRHISEPTDWGILPVGTVNHVGDISDSEPIHNGGNFRCRAGTIFCESGTVGNNSQRKG